MHIVISLEWPLRSHRYEYGIYSDQVLQVYFPRGNASARTGHPRAWTENASAP